MNISKKAWKEICDVLEKHKIPYTTRYESRVIQKVMECPDITVQDKHIYIENLVILNFFEENE